jgi:hypothetical protein
MTDELLRPCLETMPRAPPTSSSSRGMIEDIPLPDGSVDVVISNCVINLSVDNPKMISEMFWVPSPTPLQSSAAGSAASLQKLPSALLVTVSSPCCRHGCRRKPSPG